MIMMEEIKSQRNLYPDGHPGLSSLSSENYLIGQIFIFVKKISHFIINFFVKSLLIKTEICLTFR